MIVGVAIVAYRNLQERLGLHQFLASRSGLVEHCKRRRVESRYLESFESTSLLVFVATGVLKGNTGRD
jgi:hypothetical protein